MIFFHIKEIVRTKVVVSLVPFMIGLLGRIAVKLIKKDKQPLLIFRNIVFLLKLTQPVLLTSFSILDLLRNSLLHLGRSSPNFIEGG